MKYWKNITKLFSISLLTIFVLFACERTPAPVPEAKIPNINVNAQISGVVVDQNGEPMENVQVDYTKRNLSSMTDKYGHFTLSSSIYNSYGSLIQAEKSGYFTSHRMIQPQEGQELFMEIRMLPRTLTQTFETSDGATVSRGDAHVTFSPNSIRDANNQSYEGAVNVYMHYFDPLSVETGITMPGDLRAISEEQEIVTLETYGMVAVELEDAAGNELNLKEGSTASIDFPLPTEMQSGARNVMPLWYFNETNGYWEEEGQATMQGDSYLGEVTHFSFWNCDYPYPLVELSGRVIDANGVPLQVYVHVKLNGQGGGGGQTDEDGYFGGKVPRDEVLNLEVRSNGCYDLIHSEEIGPFTTDTDLGDIILAPSNSLVSLSGLAQTCDGDPIINGSMQVFLDNSYPRYYKIKDGIISSSFHACGSNSMDVIVIDYDSETESPLTTWDVSSGGDIDLGTINTCDALSQYFRFDHDGQSYSFFNVTASGTASGQGISIWAHGSVNSADSSNASITVMEETVGLDQNPIYASIYSLDPANPGNDFGVSCQQCDDFIVTFSEVGIVGEYVLGTFSGSIMNFNTGEIEEIENGEFAALRQ